MINLLNFPYNLDVMMQEEEHHKQVWLTNDRIRRIFEKDSFRNEEELADLLEVSFENWEKWKRSNEFPSFLEKILKTMKTH